MRIPAKVTATTAALALSFAPAALANGHFASHGSTSTKTNPARACATESKKHVAGTPGTPFSKCVADMAKLAGNSKTNPARACANESKKHVAGMPGTPFSQCVVAAAKLRGEGHGARSA